MINKVKFIFPKYTSKSFWCYARTVNVNFRVDANIFNKRTSNKEIKEEDNNIFQKVISPKQFVDKEEWDKLNIRKEITETDQVATIDHIVKSDKAKFIAKSSKVSSSAFSRGLKFANLGVGIAASGVKDMIMDKASFNGINKSFRSYLVNESSADRLSMTLCKLRGAALKFGQIISSFEDIVIPPVIKNALERSRKEAEAMPKRQLMQVMADNLGSDWISKFKQFDEEPFAAASIGQVHVGVLLDGMKVAVKVQYPGVAKSISSDINAVKRIFTSVILISAKSDPQGHFPR